MPLWLTLALTASIVVGVNNLLLKVIALKKIDPTGFLFIQGIIFMLGWSLWIILVWWYDIFPLKTIIVSFCITLAAFMNVKTTLFSLRYLSASEFFIGYRIGVTTSLIVIGLLIFHEVITASQYLGMGIGMIALLFLFEKQSWERHWKVWLNGILLLIISAIMAVIVQSITKIIIVENIPLFLFFFWEGIFYMIFSLLFDPSKIRTIGNIFQDLRSSFLLLVSTGIFNFLWALTITQSFQYGWNISVVTKIVSYSLFVPIIFSHFVYKEPVTPKKWIAFSLTLLSIWYLI